MAKDPAILFYTADFRQGTITFTDEQTGQYIRLLCDQHQIGPLPDHHMLNICQSYDNPVFSKFVKTPKGWYNKRMQEEVDRRKAYSDSRRKNRLSKSYDSTYDTTHDPTYDRTHEKDMSIHMDTETETDTITKTGNVIKSSIEVRTAQFSEHIQDYHDKYSGDMLSSFFKYWKEPDRARKFMRFEKQDTWDIGTRLERWADNAKQKAGPEAGVNAKGQGRKLSTEEIFGSEGPTATADDFKHLTGGN